jgi:hypothetical protein
LLRAAVVAAALLCTSLGARALAPASKYTVTTNAVLDKATGLTWERGAGPTNTWQGAKAYCSALTLDSATWRLPTVKELQTLIDPTTSTFSQPPFTGPSPGGYWTSTEIDPTVGGTAWMVYFGQGQTYQNTESDNTLQERCVH